MAPRRKIADIKTPIRKPFYTNGDQVWVLWSNIYYRGKILEPGIDHYYYVHFWKYSKNWDRPLPITRIIPVMPENDKWVKKHNEEIKTPINARKKIYRDLAKCNKNVKEVPPFLTLHKLDKLDLSKYKYKVYSSKPTTSACNDVNNSHNEGNDHVNNNILNSTACTTIVPLNSCENTKNAVIKNTIDEESYVTEEGDLSIKNASTSSFSDESNDEKIIHEAIIMPDGSIQKIKSDSEDIDFPVNNDDPEMINYDQGFDELNQNSNGTVPVSSFMPGLRVMPFANIQSAWPSSSDGNDCADESLLPINDHNNTENNVEITIFGSEGHIATIDVRFDPRFNILSSIEGNQNLENLNESPMEVESNCDDYDTNPSECLTVATSDVIDFKTDLNAETQTFKSSTLDINDENLENLPGSSAVPDFVCNKSVNLHNGADSQSMQSYDEMHLCDQVRTSTHVEKSNPNDGHLTSLKENSVVDNSTETHNLCDQVTTSTHEEELNPNNQQDFISLNENSMTDQFSDALTVRGTCLSSMNSNETHNLCHYVTTSTLQEKLLLNQEQLSSLKDNLTSKNSIDQINEAGSSSVHSNETYNLYDQVTTPTNEDQLNPNDEHNLTSQKEIADNSSDLAVDDTSTLSMIVTESYEQNHSIISVAGGSTQGELIIDDMSMSSIVIGESNDEGSCLMNVPDGSTQDDLAVDDTSLSSIMVTESNEESRPMNISSESIHGDKSSHCMNGNWSSPCSSTSVRYYEENDGQTLDDDEQYVKTKKVSKKKVKLNEEDRKIYKKFAYDKQYSRAAKVKATEAISQMSKPPINKEKKSDVGKRPKNVGKKKDDDEISLLVQHLSFYNIIASNRLKQIFLEDKHMHIDMRAITKLPAPISVSTILTEYASHFDILRSVGFKDCLQIFNHLIDSELLYSLELLNHFEYVKNNPGVTNDQIYGLPHLCRFILFLPMVFHVFKNTEDIITQLVHFIQQFPKYMEEKQMTLMPNIYEYVTPEYVRCTYLGLEFADI